MPGCIHWNVLLLEHKELNFHHLEQVLSRILSAVSIPSRRRKGPFTANLISVPWYLCEINSPNQHSWKHRAKCAPVKGAATAALLGRLWTKQLWDFRAVRVAAMPRTMSPCWAQQVGGRRTPGTARAALWHSAPFAIQFTSPGSVPAVLPGVTLGAVTNCKRPQSGQEMQLLNEPCCHYSKMSQGFP